MTADDIELLCKLLACVDPAVECGVGNEEICQGIDILGRELALIHGDIPAAQVPDMADITPEMMEKIRQTINQGPARTILSMDAGVAIFDPTEQGRKLELDLKLYGVAFSLIDSIDGQTRYTTLPAQDVLFHTLDLVKQQRTHQTTTISHHEGCKAYLLGVPCECLPIKTVNHWSLK